MGIAVRVIDLGVMPMWQSLQFRSVMPRGGAMPSALFQTFSGRHLPRGVEKPEEPR
jgi:hypothetical protein